VPDAAFDAAYSQNVVMNIADRQAFYREAYRALRPGGRLALSNVCAGAGEPYFPVPWATGSDTSFLATPAAMRADLIAAGFEIVEFRDTTAAIIELQRRGREQLERGTAPPAAADIIFGTRAREMQINSRRSTEEGRTLMVEALVRKP
jgi:sarcosine/dimethylglycine N-methyltransferase